MTVTASLAALAMHFPHGRCARSGTLLLGDPLPDDRVAMVVGLTSVTLLKPMRCADAAAGSNPVFGTRCVSVKLADTRLRS